MPMTGFIQIDSELSPSILRWLTVDAFCLIFVLIVWALPMGHWMQIGLVIFTLFCVVFWQIFQPKLTFISSLTVKSNYQSTYDFLEWQIQTTNGYLVTPYGYQGDVYQAKLHKIHNMGVVLILEFWVFEPFDRQMSLAVWQDQMDSDTWRQLKILANIA